MPELPISHAPPPQTGPASRDLRGFLADNEDIVTRIAKPVSIDHVGALSAQSEGPIVFERLQEFPNFRLCDILVKHRWSQCRALGVDEKDYLRTLAYRLRQAAQRLRQRGHRPGSRRWFTGVMKWIGRNCRCPSTRPRRTTPTSPP